MNIFSNKDGLMRSAKKTYTRKKILLFPFNISENQIP